MLETSTTDRNKIHFNEIYHVSFHMLSLLREREEDEGEVEEDDPEGGEEARAQHRRVRRNQLRRQAHHLLLENIPICAVQLDMNCFILPDTRCTSRGPCPSG